MPLGSSVVEEETVRVVVVAVVVSTNDQTRWN